MVEKFPDEFKINNCFYLKVHFFSFEMEHKKCKRKQNQVLNLFNYVLVLKEFNNNNMSVSQ